MTTRYSMLFDMEEGWDMAPDPDGEYVKFTEANVDREVNWKQWATELEEYLRSKGDYGYPLLRRHIEFSNHHPADIQFWVEEEESPYVQG